MCMVSTEHDSKGTLPSYFSLGWGDTGVQDTSTDKLHETVVPVVETRNCMMRMNQTHEQKLIERATRTEGAPGHVHNKPKDKNINTKTLIKYIYPLLYNNFYF